MGELDCEARFVTWLVYIAEDSCLAMSCGRESVMSWKLVRIQARRVGGSKVQESWFYMTTLSHYMVVKMA